MAYKVSNIIPVNILLTPAGLSYANFSSCFAIARDVDLITTGSIAAGNIKEYATLEEVGQDFTTSSDPYLMATRWFANIPKPPTFTIYMWDDVNLTILDAVNDANSQAWRYWYFVPKDVTDVDADALDLADWADANTHGLPFVTSDPLAKDSSDSTDIGSKLTSAGNRHAFVGYREGATITDNASQAYAMCQLAAAFHKFNPNGLRTAITGEFQVLPGVVGEDLSTSAYTALKDKNVAFFTKIELQGSTDASRVINSRSPSSYGEFMDDVVNLDVLKNRVQVDGYNYIANAGTKRPLTPSGYAGLLSTVDATLKRFFDNGVLGRAEYTDPNDGEDKIAKYGYVLFSDPADVFDLTDTQRRNREFPTVSALAILARAAHSAAIDITVE